MQGVTVTRKSLIIVSLAIATGTASGLPVGRPDTLQGTSRRAGRSAYQMADVKKLQKGLLCSLNHEIEGVVVCALREVICINLAQEVCLDDKLRETIEKLALDGATPLIRYRAAMASVVCENPDLFAMEPWDRCTNDEELFALLSRRLQKGVLAEKE
jgi:hypothetical protein